MAIKRGKKTVSEGPNLPSEFLEMAETAFTAQQLASCWENVFKVEKAELFKYLEHSDEINLGPDNKSVKVSSCGHITFATRASYTINNDALAKMVTDGKLNIHTLIEIASFNVKKLQDVLGSKFSQVATENNPTEYLTLKASPTFKSQIESEFQDQFEAEVEKGKKELAPKPEPVKVSKAAKKKTTKKKAALTLDDSLAAINAAKKSIAEDVDSDLADILGE